MGIDQSNCVFRCSSYINYFSPLDKHNRHAVIFSHFPKLTVFVLFVVGKKVFKYVGKWLLIEVNKPL